MSTEYSSKRRRAAFFILGAILMAASAPQIIAEDEGNGSTKWTPAQLVFVPGLQVFPDSYDVRGLRLSIITRSSQVVAGVDVGGMPMAKDVQGVQVGALASMTDASLNGIQIGGMLNRSQDGGSGLQVAGLMNLIDGTDSPFQGMQIGAINGAREIDGCQIGVFNSAKADAFGGQIGFFNYARNISGLQIGLINMAENSPFRFFPILNFGF